MARTVYGTTISNSSLDTNIYNTITADGKTATIPSFGTVSKKSAGIVKLMNMFLKLLYTEKGTNYTNPEEGTNYVQVYNYAPTSAGAVRSHVQLAVDDAAEQIMYNQSLYGVPTTEQLKKAYIESFSVTYDSAQRSVVNVAIQLEVVSGDTTAVQLPSTSPY